MKRFAPVHLSDPDFDKPSFDVDEWRDDAGPPPVRPRRVRGHATPVLVLLPARRAVRRSVLPADPRRCRASSTRSAAGCSTAWPAQSSSRSTAARTWSSPTWARTRRSRATTRRSLASEQARPRHDYSRLLAAEMYGEHRPFGYCFGGSGGGFKTMSCMESTDVWDGGVPFIIGRPRVIAQRLLGAVPRHADPVGQAPADRRRDRTRRQRRHVCGPHRRGARGACGSDAHGFPTARLVRRRARIATSYASVWSMLGDKVIEYDPTYLDDFWTVPGYLGADPTASLARARIQHKTSVVKPIRADEASSSASAPDPTIFRSKAMSRHPGRVAARRRSATRTCMGSMLSITTGDAAGHNFWIVDLRDDIVITGVGEEHFAALAGIAAGDDIVIDNSVVSRVSRRTTGTRSPRLPSVGPVPCRRHAGLPAAAATHRSPVRVERRGVAPDRPLLRQGHRGREPHGRSGVPVASSVVPTISSTARKVRAPTIGSGSGSSITRCT